MSKTKTKAMTLKYWRGLSEGSRRRALTYVFPINPAIVDMLVDEKPSKSSPWWKLVWSHVRIPEPGCYYKTVINGSTYIM